MPITSPFKLSARGIDGMRIVVLAFAVFVFVANPLEKSYAVEASPVTSERFQSISNLKSDDERYDALVELWGQVDGRDRRVVIRWLPQLIEAKRVLQFVGDEVEHDDSINGRLLSLAKKLSANYDSKQVDEIEQIYTVIIDPMFDTKSGQSWLNGMLYLRTYRVDAAKHRYMQILKSPSRGDSVLLTAKRMALDLSSKYQLIEEPEVSELRRVIVQEIISLDDVVPAQRGVWLYSLSVSESLPYLVEGLSSDHVAERSLAIRYLSKHVGDKTYGYRADIEPRNQREAIEKWRAWLDSDTAP